jgi:hypothetical protein
MHTIGFLAVLYLTVSSLNGLADHYWPTRRRK